MSILLTPPIAFVAYLILVAVLAGAGQWVAPAQPASALKTSAYASGEASSRHLVSPGYGPFFTVALFFAVAHLGVLVVSTGFLTATSGWYLLGLILILLIFILG
jgi:NADH:ubiquinone oxidoreductase subunit 3 (subunit A)